MKQRKKQPRQPLEESFLSRILRLGSSRLYEALKGETIRDRYGLEAFLAEIQKQYPDILQTLDAVEAERSTGGPTPSRFVNQIRTLPNEGTWLKVQAGIIAACKKRRRLRQVTIEEFKGNRQEFCIHVRKTYANHAGEYKSLAECLRLMFRAHTFPSYPRWTLKRAQELIKKVPR